MADMVNINRLLKLLPDFFRHASAVAVELCQNAARASATKVDVTFKGNVMTVKDNGHGAEMAAPLLVLADSGWGEKAMRQAPAGFGCFFLYAISSQVTMRSKFGELVVDCARFFDDAMYRQSVLSTVDRSKTGKGMIITAVLKEDVVGDVHDGWNHLLKYFPIKVTVDGRQVEKCAVRDGMKDEHLIETTYCGNAVFISPFVFSGTELADKDLLAKDTLTIWYGTIVHRPSRPACAISVTEGTPLTPVLPLRDGLKRDGKLDEFRAFVREAVISYLTAILNDPAARKSDLDRAIAVLAEGAAQEELDKLPRWVVRRDDPFNDTYRIGDMGDDRLIVVSKGDVLESEVVKLLISHDGEKYEEDDTDNIIVADGLFTEIVKRHANPSWLTIKEVVREIRITATESYRRYFTWYESTIDCAGKNIKALSLVDGSWDGKIYYTPDHASDGFGEIQGAVFRMRVHSDDTDSDSYDSQEANYEEEVGADLQHLTGRYSLYDILKSVAEISGSRTDQIRSIEVKRGAVVLSLKRGKTKTLKLVA